MQTRCVVIMALVLSLSSLASSQSVRCCTERAPDQPLGAHQVTAQPDGQPKPEVLLAVASDPAVSEADIERLSAASAANSHKTSVALESHAPAQERPHASPAQHCLSLNVYWEARNQSIAGQIAVAQVTLNRARDRRFPNDICEVVYDHKQFSWYWDGKSDKPLDSRAWAASMLVASAALAGSGHAELQGVTHYHAVYSQPYWRSYMTQVTKIGDHIFYSD